MKSLVFFFLFLQLIQVTVQMSISVNNLEGVTLEKVSGTDITLIGTGEPYARFQITNDSKISNLKIIIKKWGNAMEV